MRVVLDTNVLLAAVATHGLCELILDACVSTGEHQVVASAYIVHEVQRQLKDKFNLPPDDVRAVLDLLRGQTELAVPSDVPADACRYPEDLPILGTLLAAAADCLVTGDRDLLALRQYEGRPILSPREFYGRFCGE